MKTSKTSDIMVKTVVLLAMVLVGCLTAPAAAAKAKKKPPDKAVAKLREIRVAVFAIDVLKGVKVESGALTDQINVILADLPKVTIVNRDQIKKVADEHKMALTGLVDVASAVKLGKFLSAQYIVVGRAGKIGSSYYLVLKIVNVETTVQITTSAKAAADDGIEALLEKLTEPLRDEIRRLQKAVPDAGDTALAKLRKAARPLAGSVVLVNVTETHLNRPLKDPAAQMAIAHRLRSLGFEVVVPKDPKIGWKGKLLKRGTFGDAKIDYLVEGEGVSAFAASIHGMVSCRARVELRVIKLPGRTVTVSDRGVAANVDLVEALAAKGALEQASILATDGVVKRLTELKVKGEKDRKKKD